jgi:hypothetical protein
MTSVKSISNRMECIRNRARSGIKKPTPKEIHAAALALNNPLADVQWVSHQWFPEAWHEATKDNLRIEINLMTDFKTLVWRVSGARALYGECNNMKEAKFAVEKVIGFLLREAQE